MFCIKCGANIPEDSKFCTSCGEKVIEGTPRRKPRSRKSYWTRKKSLLLILLSIILTSILWLFIHGSGIITIEDESVNIIAHSLETIGRQIEAQSKTEQIIDLFSYGLSDECLYTPGCVDDTIGTITALRAEIDKEIEEIDKLWSTGVVGRDLESYFSGLDEKNQIKILEIIEVYFPEEAEELETSATLL